MVTSTFLTNAVQNLRRAGIEHPWREARLLLAHCLDKPYEEVFCQPPISLPPNQLTEFNKLVRRRLDDEPLSKIVGFREFWGLSFKITQDTLDPRADSETIIEAVLEAFPDKQQPYRILDLGTGTGCLLISLLTEYPYASGIGADISQKALQVAQENGQHHLSSGRAVWLCSDWMQEISGTFDIIVCNPPYIAEDEKLPRAVRGYDPAHALFAGKDGLNVYHTLIPQLNTYTKPNGKLFFEVGFDQISCVKRIIKTCGAQWIHCRKDIQGIDRVAIFAYRT